MPLPPQSPATAATDPYVVEDCLGVLQLLSDGTVVRATAPPSRAGAGDDDDDDGRVEWRDAVYDADHSLGLRMYRPQREEESKEKLPVVVFFHGGGFCVGSYTWPKTHHACLRLAAELPAVVLSFGYRLAPEHRLPAALDDGAAALLWLRGQLVSNPWLADVADAHRVFVSGESAGGTLSHHLAMRFGTAGLEPVRIAGYVLITPGFFSEEPTQSELDTPATAFLTRELCDQFFRLGMPAGADKDDPLVSPFGPGSPCMEAVDVGRMLVVAAGNDMFRDRDVQYAERMKAMGKDVELVMFAAAEHGFFGADLHVEATSELVGLIRRFVQHDAVAVMSA